MFPFQQDHQYRITEPQSHLLATKNSARVHQIRWVWETCQSMFGHKQQYDHGDISKGVLLTWFKRGTGTSLIFQVPKHTRETLTAGLVQQFVEP